MKLALMAATVAGWLLTATATTLLLRTQARLAEEVSARQDAELAVLEGTSILRRCNGLLKREQLRGAL